MLMLARCALLRWEHGVGSASAHRHRLPCTLHAVAHWPSVQRAPVSRPRLACKSRLCTRHHVLASLRKCLTGGIICCPASDPPTLLPTHRTSSAGLFLYLTGPWPTLCRWRAVTLARHTNPDHFPLQLHSPALHSQPHPTLPTSLHPLPVPLHKTHRPSSLDISGLSS